MAANDGSVKEEQDDSGFAVYNESKPLELKYPNVHGMPENAVVNIRIKSTRTGRVIISDYKSGKKLGDAKFSAEGDWQTISVDLQNPSGDNNIMLKLPKGAYLDYFSILSE